MKITKRQLRRIIREEKSRLLTENMAGYEGSEIPNYIMSDVLPTLAYMIHDQTTAADMVSLGGIEDTVKSMLLDCMSRIAADLELN
jgi:hypothetical protein